MDHKNPHLGQIPLELKFPHTYTKSHTSFTKEALTLLYGKKWAQNNVFQLDGHVHGKLASRREFRLNATNMCGLSGKVNQCLILSSKA